MNVDPNPSEYYRRREADEREIAAKAADKTIRDIHLNMADRYRKLAQDAARLEYEGPG